MWVRTVAYKHGVIAAHLSVFWACCGAHRLSEGTMSKNRSRVVIILTAPLDRFGTPVTIISPDGQRNDPRIVGKNLTVEPTSYTATKSVLLLPVFFNASY